MANEEQLSILKQGVEAWNQWRAEHSSEHIWTIIDLTESNLSGADLINANLSSVSLIRADLKGANLSTANLRGAKLMEADLRGANLKAAQLSGAYLRGAYLSGADLRDADLRGADLSDVDLSEANLNGANLRGAYLIRSNLRHADLTETNLHGAYLNDAALFEVDITGADLTYRAPRPSPPPGSMAAPDIPSPDEISFTAIYPKEAKVETWHTLLVYAHLRSVMEQVRRDARRFEDQIWGPKAFTSPAPTRIVRGTEITIIPSCPGIIFNPERIVVKWMEDYQRADFRFRADKSLSDDVARGQIDIYVGPIIVGTLRLAMLLNDEDSQIQRDREEQSRIYHQEEIFASYSHKDSEVVLACKKAYEALGFNVLIDIDTLRSGQIWNEQLMQMIDRATIFQLFWSQNSSQSKYCRQEWEHALRRNKEGFIRPVYWEVPMPDPPEELSKYHFQYIRLST